MAVAEFQTAGRGRLGRRWEAPPGSNLLVSVLLRPALRPEQQHLAAAALALAAADASEGVAGVPLAVKWPNDLLGPDGRKVAGVLAEADVGGGPVTVGPPPAVVVGIGINVNWPASDDDLPADLVGAAGSLRQLAGSPVDRGRLLAALLEALEPRVEDLATPAGRARQAEALRTRCTTLGADVVVELADARFEGRAVDLTPDGHLVVETAGARRTVVAGDVVHLRSGAGGSPAPGSRPGRL